MKIKVLSSKSNSTIASSALVKTSLTSQSFNPTIISPIHTRASYTGTTVRPDLTGYLHETSFSSSTAVKNIVKTTKQSIHRLRKKIKSKRQIKNIRKKPNEEKDSSQILNKSFDVEKSVSNITFIPHGGNVALNNSLHENVEEKTAVYNTTKSAFFYSANTRGTDNHDGEQLSLSTKTSPKINNSLQRTYAPIDSQNSTRKVNSQISNQNSSLPDLSSNTKPPLEKKEIQDLKPPGITPNKKEIDLRNERILIWDELKDCAQPFETSSKCFDFFPLFLCFSESIFKRNSLIY